MKDRSAARPLELFGPQYVASLDSPLGRVWIESDEEAILRVSFENIGRGRSGEPKVLKAAVKQMKEYFRKRRKVFDLPAAPARIGFPQPRVG